MTRTLEEQTNSLAAYLPNGKLWGAKYQEGTVVRGLLAGLSGELLRSAALVEEFRDQIIPCSLMSRRPGRSRTKFTLFLKIFERPISIKNRLC